MKKSSTLFATASLALAFITTPLPSQFYQVQAEENQSENSPSDREGNGQHPFSEDEVTLYMQPTIPFNINQIMTLDDFEGRFDQLSQAHDQGPISIDQLTEIMGEPSLKTKYDQSDVYTYVAANPEQPDRVLQLAVYLDNDQVTQVYRSNLTEKMLKPLAIKEEDLNNLVQQPEVDILKALEKLFGSPEQENLLADKKGIEYVWGFYGDESGLEEDDITGVAAQVVDGQIEGIGFETKKDRDQASQEDQSENREESSNDPEAASQEGQDTTE